MTGEDFDILATKALMQEATPEERAQLDGLLADDAARRGEFADLQAAWKALREFGPLTQAMDAPPIVLPDDRLVGLQGAVREHFPRPSPDRSQSPGIVEWLRQLFGLQLAVAGSLAALLVAAGMFLFFQSSRKDSSGREAAALVGYLLVSSGQPEVLRDGKPVGRRAAIPLRQGDQIALPEGTEAEVIARSGLVRLKGPRRLPAQDLDLLARTAQASTASSSNRSPLSAAVQGALFRPLGPMLATGLLITTRDTQGVSLYCPRVATSSLQPSILWKAEPGKTYDLTITDEFDKSAPPWKVRAAVSPVDFGQVWKNRPLAEDSLYRLIVCETGNPLSASEYTFRTFKDARGMPPQTPAEKITYAYQLLTSVPPYPGDALVALFTLPSEFAESEPVLRLKLALFGELGLSADYDNTATKLRTLSDGQRQ